MYDTDDDVNITHTIVDPKFRGHGLARQFKDKLMSSLNLSCLTMTIDLDNTPSLRAVEKLPGVEKVSDPEYETAYHKAKFTYS